MIATPDVHPGADPAALHTPVMLARCLELLAPAASRPGAVVVDLPVSAFELLALAPDDRFQEKRAATVRRVGQLQIEAKGRVEIGKRLGQQRNPVVALGREGLEFDLGHVGKRRSR